MTGEQYETLEKAQNFCCAICQSPAPLVVDHDHVTKEIRGLLCATCNKGLGMLGDTAASLLLALKYLTK